MNRKASICIGIFVTDPSTWSMRKLRVGVRLCALSKVTKQFRTEGVLMPSTDAVLPSTGRSLRLPFRKGGGPAAAPGPTWPAGGSAQLASLGCRGARGGRRSPLLLGGAPPVPAALASARGAQNACPACRRCLRAHPSNFGLQRTVPPCKSLWGCSSGTIWFARAPPALRILREPQAPQEGQRGKNPRPNSVPLLRDSRGTQLRALTRSPARQVRTPALPSRIRWVRAAPRRISPPAAAASPPSRPPSRAPAAARPASPAPGGSSPRSRPN